MAIRIDQLDDNIGIITNIQFYSIYDGPGIRTNVFLKGCNLRCRWCHNPEGVSRWPEVFPYYPNCTGCGECVAACPSGAITLIEPTKPTVDKVKCTSCFQCIEVCKTQGLAVFGKFVTVNQVMEEVEKDKPFYENSGGGMTLSGGDPTNQPDFCRALLKSAKERGINTCLDTNGYAEWETIESMIEYVDWFLWDIKSMDSHAHKDWAGVGNERILENVRKVAQRAKLRIRFPVIPNINDSDDNLKKTAEFIESLGPNVEGVDLLPYHPYAGAKYRLFCLDYNFPIGEGYNEDRLIEMMDIFEPHVSEVTIGG